MPRLRTLMVVAVAGLASACASTKPPPAAAAPDAQTAAALTEAWRSEDYDYRIGPGDELGVRFPINAEMDTQVTVGPDGRATFPHIAPVRVAGLTVEQANSWISDHYKSVLRNPVTQITIYNYGGGQVYIAGEVRNPGARSIKGDYSIMRAIFESGGFEPTAGMGKVVLLRRRPTDGKVLMRVIDSHAALRGDVGADMRVLPGDVIFVPRSRIAEVNRIVQQYITNALPFSMNYDLTGRNNGR